MTEQVPAPSAARTAVVWESLRRALAARCTARGLAALDVLDAGGGTGGFAVPLAELGHTVTVVDPSPDSLAALERRAAECGVSGRVRALQGEAADLADLVGSDVMDLVLCHSLLEYVDDPVTTLVQVARTARRAGTVSVLVANRTAAVLHRAMAGHVDEAHYALTDPDGRWGERDPMPRRFTTEGASALVERAGLRIGPIHGVRVFADIVPGGLAEADAHAVDALLALESAAAEHPVLRDVATQIHVLGYR